MLNIHILTINDFQGGVKCALVCVFLKKIIFSDFHDVVNRKVKY